MTKTSKEKQEDYRARMALLGMKEVRGIYLPEALHPVIKEQAAKLLEHFLDCRRLSCPTRETPF